jgi:hypothetical protein
MSLDSTVENLIDVLNDIINSGYLRGSDMEEHAKDNIRYAQKDLAYMVQTEKEAREFWANEAETRQHEKPLCG